MFENWDSVSYLVGLALGMLIGFVNGRSMGWRKGFDEARRIYLGLPPLHRRRDSRNGK